MGLNRKLRFPSRRFPDRWSTGRGGGWNRYDAIVLTTCTPQRHVWLIAFICFFVIVLYISLILFKFFSIEVRHIYSTHCSTIYGKLRKQLYCMRPFPPLTTTKVLDSIPGGMCTHRGNACCATLHYTSLDTERIRGAIR